MNDIEELNGIDELNVNKHINNELIINQYREKINIKEQKDNLIIDKNNKNLKKTKLNDNTKINDNSSLSTKSKNNILINKKTIKKEKNKKLS